MRALMDNGSGVVPPVAVLGPALTTWCLALSIDDHTKKQKKTKKQGGGIPAALPPDLPTPPLMAPTAPTGKDVRAVYMR